MCVNLLTITVVMLKKYEVPSPRNLGSEEIELVIEITTVKLYLRNTEKYFYEAIVHINGRDILLHTLNHNNWLLVEKDQQYDVVFQYTTELETKKIKLPSKMNMHLFTYLKNGRRENECCMDFINALYYGPQTFKVNSIFLSSVTQIENCSSLKIGQAVGARTQSNYNPSHFGIYLDDGLCLSILGNNGLLVVTTYEQMINIYDCDTLLAVYPIYVPHVPILTDCIQYIARRVESTKLANPYTLFNAPLRSSVSPAREISEIDERINTPESNDTQYNILSCFFRYFERNDTTENLKAKRFRPPLI